MSCQVDKLPECFKRDFMVLIEATIAEIDAISKLDFDSSKVKGLAQIAAREPLYPPCQEYLVGTVFRSLDFDPSKKKVLVTLIRNRTFSFEAKRAILNRLEKLSFDSTKKDILDELNRRGPLAPVTEEVIPLRVANSREPGGNL